MYGTIIRSMIYSSMIYTKSLKNNFEIVHFETKFEIVSGDGEIMTGRGWFWVVAAKLWLIVSGRGWSHDLVMRYIKQCANVKKFRNKL